MGRLDAVASRAGRLIARWRDALGDPSCVLCGERLDPLLPERALSAGDIPRDPPRDPPRNRPGLGIRRALCAACTACFPWWRRADGCPRCGMPLDPDRPASEASWGPPRADEGDPLAAPSPTPAHRSAACPRCLAEGSPLHRCLAAARYADPLPRIVPAFKNPGSALGPRPDVRRLVFGLADELGLELVQELAHVPALVVPIPLHRHRLHQRGFNHADWIAHRLARTLALRFEPRLLERVRDTGSQAGLRAAERRANLRGAFRVAGRRSLDDVARVVLVDDVLTTSSTLDAAGDALLTAGAREVVAVVIAATSPGRGERTGPAIRMFGRPTGRLR